MSERRNEQVTCPRCGYDSPMEIWSSINVGLDPELKDKFLSGKLFEWKCEVCGHDTYVVFDTIYHDMEHRFMLFFSSIEPEDGKDSVMGIPFHNEFRLEGYTFRAVYGWNALKEKIGILEHGLSDIAVERMKYFLRLNPDNQISEGDELLFVAVDADPDIMQKCDWPRGAIVFLRLRENSEPKTLAFPMESYYDYLLASETDPRMKMTGCPCIDSRWIELKLREP